VKEAVLQVNRQVEQKQRQEQMTSEGPIWQVGIQDSDLVNQIRALRKKARASGETRAKFQ
jgi:hypothetical protein